MKIRKLTVRDANTLTDIVLGIVKLTEDDTLLKLISSTRSTVSKGGKPKKEDEAQAQDASVRLGVSLLKQALLHLREETQKWFASLLNVDLEQYYDLPIGTDIDVIVQIVESDEAGDFFTMASQLLKMTEKFKKPFEKIKGWYDSVTK